jgi:dTDP-glucose pyrophosphorylase
MPMAGEGSRFLNAGFINPKLLIPVDGDCAIRLFELATFPVPEGNKFIFITRSDTPESDEFDECIESKFNNYKIVKQNGRVPGAVLTTLIAKDFINSDEPLLILDSDVYSVWDFDDFTSLGTQWDGAVLTFKSNNPSYSYIKINDSGLIENIIEKKVISNIANAGGYFWSKGSDYVKYAEKLVNSEKTINGEFYISSVYSEAIADGKEFTSYETYKHFSLGTPDDLKSFMDLKDIDNGSNKNGYVSFDNFDTISTPEYRVEELDLNNDIKVVKNLFRLFDPRLPTKIVKGKTYIAPMSARFWHFLHETICQYEVLKSKVSDLNIYFMDFYEIFNKVNKGFDGTSVSYCKDLAKYYLSELEIVDLFVDLNYEYNMSGSNLLFEEVYFITDYNDLIPPSAWQEHGLKMRWDQTAYRSWSEDHWIGKYGRDSWIKDGVSLLRSRVLENLTPDDSYPKLLYISRRDAHARYSDIIANKASMDDGTIREAYEREYDETNLEAYFSGMGYEIVSLEGLPYITQIKYFYNADKIAGLVGSGFSNIIFSKETLELIELQVKHNFEFSYRYLVNFLDIGQKFTYVELRNEDLTTWKYVPIGWDEIKKRLDGVFYVDED